MRASRALLVALPACLVAAASGHAAGSPAGDDPGAEVRRLVEAARDLRPEARRVAVEALSRTADRRAARALASALESPDAAVRWAAAEALGRIAAGESFGPLCAALADPNWNVRRSAAAALAALGEARAVGLLVPLLEDREWRVRKAAVEGLARLKEPRAAGPLAAVVHDPEEPVRVAAAAALGELSGAEGVSALTGLLEDQAPAVRVAAARALQRLKNPAAVEPLGRAPLSRMVEGGAAGSGPAVLVLGDVGDAAAADALIKALGSPEVKTRAWAALALGRFGPAAAPAASKLMEMLGTGTEVRHREGTFCTLGGAAAAALGRIGPHARPQLVSRLKPGPRQGKADAAAALAVMVACQPADAAADEALRSVLKDEDPAVRYFAALGLGLGPGGTLADLAAAAGDADPLVRHAAICGLARQGDLRAVDRLRKLIGDKDETVRAAATAAALDFLSAPPRHGAAKRKPTAGRRPPLLALLRDEMPWGSAPEDTGDGDLAPASPLTPAWIARRAEFYRRQQRAMLALRGCLQRHSEEPAQPSSLAPLVGRSIFRNVDYVWCTGGTSDRELPCVALLGALTKLQVISRAVTDEGLAPLARLQKLRELSLYTALTGRGLTALVRLPSLRSLSLGSADLDDRELAHVGRLHGLERLLITNASSVTDAGAAHLKDLTNLVSLRLDTAPLSDAGLAQLAGMTRLEELSLPGEQLTDAGFATLAGMTHLKRVSLYRAKAGDAGLARLGKLSGLEELSLGQGHFTDAGLAQLAGLTGLQKLHLRSDQVTDVGLAPLEGLTQLRVLSIRFPRVTDAGLVHLRPLTRLEWLGLQGTRATPAGVVKLREALPKTRIE